MGIEKKSNFTSSKLKSVVIMVSQGLFSVMNVKMISYFSIPLLHWHEEGTVEEPFSRAWTTWPQVKQHHLGVQRWLGLLVFLWHASPTQNSMVTYTPSTPTLHFPLDWVSFFLKPSL